MGDALQNQRMKATQSNANIDISIHFIHAFMQYTPYSNFPIEATRIHLVAVQQIVNACIDTLYWSYMAFQNRYTLIQMSNYSERR